MENIKLSKEELGFIRDLDDFDLKMLLSEFAQLGESYGKQLLNIMIENKDQHEQT